MAESPRDDFERYFAEKLWEMIPSIYRHEDGLADPPGVLRALVEVLAEQAAVLRRSHDRLWEDQFIAWCDDWVVPYLGDLVGTRLVSALNLRGRRVDVAKTIYYRRRKGTLRVLEELISDITGWEGTVVEGFRCLARTRHGLDPRPMPLAGRHSGTLPGGWADLRNPTAAEAAGGPFDEYFHAADVRRHRGVDGRYAIPKLAFHLYRLRAFRVEGVTPHARSDGATFTADPSGRDVPFFMPRQRAGDWDDWRPAREWELPAPLRCRLLNHAVYIIDEALVESLVDDHGLDPAAADDLRTVRGVVFAGEAHLRTRLGALDHSADLLDPAVHDPLLAGALVADCGKAALLPTAIQVAESPGHGVARERTVGGDLHYWAASAPSKRLVIDPERGRLRFLGDPPDAPTVTYHYGFAAEIGAGPYGRRAAERRAPDFTHQDGGALDAAHLANDGVTQIDDSATYGPVSDKLSVQNLTLQAANGQRPYLRLDTNWMLNTGSNEDATLRLDGLWLGMVGDFAVILRGDYEEVIIEHATFDPGGEDTDGDPILAVPLVVEGQVERLTVASSIMGPVRTADGGTIEHLVIRDTIIQAPESAPLALALPDGEVTMERVTIFGAVDVNRLWATEALITQVVNVTDTQHGCFRFSAAPKESRVPKPYESHLLDMAAHFFTSQRFGEPGYGQLSQAAPRELRRGAEHGAEIGAFSGLLYPIKLDSLQAKVAEYMPFGLIPIWIFET